MSNKVLSDPEDKLAKFLAGELIDLVRYTPHDARRGDPSDDLLGTGLALDEIRGGGDELAAYVATQDEPLLAPLGLSGTITINTMVEDEGHTWFLADIDAPVTPDMTAWDVIRHAVARWASYPVMDSFRLVTCGIRYGGFRIALEAAADTTSDRELRHMPFDEECLTYSSEEVPLAAAEHWWRETGGNWGRETDGDWEGKCELCGNRATRAVRCGCGVEAQCDECWRTHGALEVEASRRR